MAATTGAPRPTAIGTTLLAHPHTLSTPLYSQPSPGIFTIHSKIHIAATPLQCLRATLDTTTYPAWNPFCPFISIDSHAESSSSSSSTTPPASTQQLLEAIVSGTGPLGDHAVTVPSDAAAAAARQRSFLQLGTRFTEAIFMDGSGLAGPEKAQEGAKGSRPTALVISVLEDASDAAAGTVCLRVAWKGVATGVMGWMLHSERVHEFVDDGHGGCVYENWETFVGPVTYIVKGLFGQTLVDRFGDWSAGLKAYLEKGSSA